MATRPNKIVVMTGSGISAESGIATFRDQGGVWAQYDYRDVATPEGFAADPDLVHRFYNDRRKALSTVRPNAAHFALGELQASLKARGGSLSLVTQNVDDLHERGGAENVWHMHGELLKATCAFCGDVRAWHDGLSTALVCEVCERPGGMRPYVVWFGEIPRHMDDAADALMGADLFVSIGTSGSVYPAAGFVAQARALGVDTIELNLEPSENAHQFTRAEYGRASEIVPAWVSSVL